MIARTQRYIGKSIQGLLRRTRSGMCLSLINWFSLESYVDEKKLSFFGRPQFAAVQSLRVSYLFDHL
jgi:hypothetical protein